MKFTSPCYEDELNQLIDVERQMTDAFTQLRVAEGMLEYYQQSRDDAIDEKERLIAERAHIYLSLINSMSYRRYCRVMGIKTRLI